MIAKTLTWGYLILFFWCAVIIIVALLVGDQSPLAEKAFDAAAEGFKIVLAAAIGSFSTLAGSKKSAE